MSNEEAPYSYRVDGGTGLAGPVTTILISAYLILLAVFLLYGLLQFWPSLTQAGDTVTNPEPVPFLFWTFSMSSETRLFIVVAMAGALGSLVHALESLAWYVGNRVLVVSWVLRYIMMPITGAVLGIIFYLVIRGGFFSPEATIAQTSPFAFAGVAGLVGMFSDQAIDKLKKVAGSVFTEKEPEPGKDALPRGKLGEEEEY